jgi:hypothetical protein
MRKHYTQMSPGEIQHLLAAVRQRNYDFIPHAFDAMGNRRITPQQVMAVLSYCSIIEAHENVPGDLRVLVRGKIKGDFVCVVLSLTRSTVVTVYWNRAGDYHKTLDKTVYSWTADLSQR